MRFGALLLLPLVVSGPASGSVSGSVGAQDEGQHEGTFEEALAHRSGDDLRGWKQRHPWSLGDRLGAFLGDLLAVRHAADRTGIEQHELTSAFLVESIAQDPFSGWIIDVLGWDTEACARHETAADAVRLLPSIVAAGEGDSAWAQLDEVRKAVAPPGGMSLLAPDLARCAAAYLHAGDRERAKRLATEIASSAEELRQGAVVCACERILGEVSRLEGDVDGAAQRVERAFGIAPSLDSGPVTSLLVSIEGLAACGVDALVEITPAEKWTLVVVVSEKERTVRKIPIDGRALVERVRRAIEPSLDAAALRELREAILGPEAGLFGKALGVVADGAIADAPLEALASESGSVVRLGRPPLGAAAENLAPSAAKRTWLAILDERAASPVLGSDEVRALRVASVEEMRKAVPGCTHVYVDTDSLSPEAFRGLKFDVELAVLARPPGAGLLDALHASGVRDVLACARVPEADERRFLADVCGRIAKGMPLLESLRAARAAVASSPRTWTSWIVRRRS